MNSETAIRLKKHMLWNGKGSSGWSNSWMIKWPGGQYIMKCTHVHTHAFDQLKLKDTIGFG